MSVQKFTIKNTALGNAVSSVYSPSPALTKGTVLLFKNNMGVAVDTASECLEYMKLGYDDSQYIEVSLFTPKVNTIDKVKEI
jgi:hypothetical protein